MRRVRRNIISRPDGREIETESWGFRRSNSRQPRLRAPVNAGTLNQRLANLEEEVAEINLALAKQASCINSLNNRMGFLEGGPGCGPFANYGPPSLPFDPSCAPPAGPYAVSDISMDGCGQPIPCEPYVPGPYSYQSGITSYPPNWGSQGGCPPNWGPGGCPPNWGPGGCPPNWGSGGCPPNWGPGCPPNWGQGGCPPNWGQQQGGYYEQTGGCSGGEGGCSKGEGCCKKKSH
jgi:hypothetical protein